MKRELMVGSVIIDAKDRFCAKCNFKDINVSCRIFKKKLQTTGSYWDNSTKYFRLQECLDCERGEYLTEGGDN